MSNGLSWLCHLSLHYLPVLLPICAAIYSHWFGPISAIILNRRISCSSDHARFEARPPVYFSSVVVTSPSEAFLRFCDKNQPNYCYKYTYLSGFFWLILMGFLLLVHAFTQIKSLRVQHLFSLLFGLRLFPRLWLFGKHLRSFSFLASLSCDLEFWNRFGTLLRSLKA